MSKSDHIVLYGTTACHLCDEAVVIIQEALTHFPEQNVEYIDIVDSDEWVNRYGTHIPVLVNETCFKELFWPFSRETVVDWLNDQWLNGDVCE